MTYHGRVRNGKIELEEAVSLPEGTAVQVMLAPVVDAGRTDDRLPPSLYEQFEPFIGSIDDLPEDLSVNHDHYLYGTRKRQ